MILDLRLPAGWTQRPIRVEADPLDAAAATPAVGTSGPEPTATGASLHLAELQGGRIIWPPFESSDEESANFAPAALLISPLLPLLRSPTLLLQAALDSEPDYERQSESPFLSVRLGPWEVTALETTGRSRQDAIPSARLYAVLDAGYGAYMMVFIDCDPSRIALRRDQLVELISEAQLRSAPRPADPAATESPAPGADELPTEEEPPTSLAFSEKLPETADLAEVTPEPSGEPSDEPAEVVTADSIEDRLAAVTVLSAAAVSPGPGADKTNADGALPTPPQRPAEDVYLKGNLFPHLID
jgi:hypothetical protein